IMYNITEHGLEFTMSANEFYDSQDALLYLNQENTTVSIEEFAIDYGENELYAFPVLRFDLKQVIVLYEDAESGLIFVMRDKDNMSTLFVLQLQDYDMCKLIRAPQHLYGYDENDINEEIITGYNEKIEKVVSLLKASFLGGDIVEVY
ncbi:MAG: hypothetical protein NZM44_05980, partial [Candidatus Calescibacterium sp.]|nr:hypothetical protein [Candidatus Calescibacterium sp.]